MRLILLLMATSALRCDGRVHALAQPNGYGIIRISGSAYTRPLAYAAPELKLSGEAQLYSGALARAGYTAFEINHRAFPRCRYPAAVEDAQPAVRFIRAHAGEFGIDKDRIGAQGGSWGLLLVSTLGVLDGKGNADSAAFRMEAMSQCSLAPSTHRIFWARWCGGSTCIFGETASDVFVKVVTVWGHGAPRANIV